MVWFSLVTQNTFALALMEQGQRTDGMELLVEVLTDIQDRCEEGQTWRARASRRATPLQTEALVDPTIGRDAVTTGGKIFHHAFHLPQEKPISLDGMTAVVLFNYAVAIHIKAIEDDSFELLERALQKYNLVLGLDVPQREVSLLAPVQAAAMHNTSAICSACKMNKKARDIRGHLSVMLERSSPRFDGPETRAFFQPRAMAA